jgi:hypothetical protein
VSQHPPPFSLLFFPLLISLLFFPILFLLLHFLDPNSNLEKSSTVAFNLHITHTAHLTRPQPPWTPPPSSRSAGHVWHLVSRDVAICLTPLRRSRACIVLTQGEELQLQLQHVLHDRWLVPHRLQSVCRAFSVFLCHLSFSLSQRMNFTVAPLSTAGECIVITAAAATTTTIITAHSTLPALITANLLKPLPSSPPPPYALLSMTDGSFAAFVCSSSTTTSCDLSAFVSHVAAAAAACSSSVAQCCSCVPYPPSFNL